MKTYHTETLGCKVNQYETRQIEEVLEWAGLSAAPDGSAADLVVVNTCVVTAEAAQQCRQTIRRLQRANPAARLVVTGCYAAESQRDELAAIAGISLLVADKDDLRRRLAEELTAGGNDNSNGTPDYHRGLVTATTTAPDVPRSACPTVSPFAPQRHPPAVLGASTAPGGISRFRGHARAFVKIQDGCDQRCSYCVVPLVRPTPRSRPADEVLEEVRRLVGAGHREIVLSGIHLGRYGKDSSPGAVPAGGASALSHLVERLVELPLDFRLRLSSLEAAEMDDALLDLLAGQAGRLCPHLHLPLQSGDDGVLRVMRRPYTVGEFLERLERARRRVPHLAVTTDLIVGFPGEAAAAFDRTCEVVCQAGFSRLHVFPFSPRRGTPAAAMPGQVPHQERRRRAETLRALGEELAARFAAGLVGREVTVLVEEVDEQRGLAEGYDEHYVRTQFAASLANPVARGDLVRVRATGSAGAALPAAAD